MKYESKERLWNKNYITLLAVMLASNSGLTMISAVITPFVVSMGYTLGIAGAIAGAMTIASMLMRPVSGVIGDTFSKKNTILVFTVLSAMTIAGSAITTNMIFLFFLRIAFGIFFSIATTIMMVLVGEYSPADRMGEGLGYYGAGMGVAQATGPSLGFFAANRYSYKTAFFLAAILIFLAALLILWLPDNTVKRERGSEKKRRQISVKNVFALQVLPLMPACFCIGAVLGIENSFLALFAGENGIDNIGWYFTLYGVVMIGIRLFGGKLMDKWPFHTVLHIGSALIAFTFILIGTAIPPVMEACFCLAAAARAVGIGILQPALQKTCLKSVDAGRQSTASGMYYLGSDLGMGLTPMIGAFIYGLAGNSYRAIFLIYIVFVVIAVAVYWIFRKKSPSGH